MPTRSTRKNQQRKQRKEKRLQKTEQSKLLNQISSNQNTYTQEFEQKNSTNNNFFSDSEKGSTDEDSDSSNGNSSYDEVAIFIPDSLDYTDIVHGREGTIDLTNDGNSEEIISQEQKQNEEDEVHIWIPENTETSKIDANINNNVEIDIPQNQEIEDEHFIFNFDVAYKDLLDYLSGLMTDLLEELKFGFRKSISILFSVMFAIFTATSYAGLYQTAAEHHSLFMRMLLWVGTFFPQVDLSLMLAYFFFAEIYFYFFPSKSLQQLTEMNRTFLRIFIPILLSVGWSIGATIPYAMLAAALWIFLVFVLIPRFVENMLSLTKTNKPIVVFGSKIFDNLFGKFFGKSFTDIEIAFNNINSGIVSNHYYTMEDGKRNYIQSKESVLEFKAYKLLGNLVETKKISSTDAAQLLIELFKKGKNYLPFARDSNFAYWKNIILNHIISAFLLGVWGIDGYIWITFKAFLDFLLRLHPITAHPAVRLPLSIVGTFFSAGPFTFLVYFLAKEVAEVTANWIIFAGSQIRKGKMPDLPLAFKSWPFGLAYCAISLPLYLGTSLSFTPTNILNAEIPLEPIKSIGVWMSKIGAPPLHRWVTALVVNAITIVLARLFTKDQSLRLHTYLYALAEKMALIFWRHANSFQWNRFVLALLEKSEELLASSDMVIDTSTESSPLVANGKSKSQSPEHEMIELLYQMDFEQFKKTVFIEFCRQKVLVLPKEPQELKQMFKDFDDKKELLDTDYEDLTKEFVILLLEKQVLTVKGSSRSAEKPWLDKKTPFEFQQLLCQLEANDKKEKLKEQQDKKYNRYRLFQQFKDYLPWSNHQEQSFSINEESNKNCPQILCC